MIRDLIINLSFLISFVSIASHLQKEEELTTTSNLRMKLAAGLTAGTLGVVLIYFGFHPTANTVIDFRNIVFTMAVIYGGPLPLAVCALMIASFRITYFGASVTSYAAIVSTTVMCIADTIISRQRLRTWIRWLIISAFNTLVLCINLAYVIRGDRALLTIIPIYCISSALVSFLTYHYVKYSLTANRLYRKLKSESTRDYLTGLNNVRSFDRLFNGVVENSREKNEQVSLLMIDIDFFKKVNDTYGHHQGDLVLKKLGEILIKNSRSFDIVSRNGGEEFTVILLDCPSGQAGAIAERIRKTVEGTSFVLSDNIKIRITVSIGIASYPESTANHENLLELSDAALYKAKRTGRNKVVLIEPEQIQS